MINFSIIVGLSIIIITRSELAYSFYTCMKRGINYAKEEDTNLTKLAHIYYTLLRDGEKILLLVIIRIKIFTINDSVYSRARTRIILNHVSKHLETNTILLTLS